MTHQKSVEISQEEIDLKENLESSKEVRGAVVKNLELVLDSLYDKDYPTNQMTRDEKIQTLRISIGTKVLGPDNTHLLIHSGGIDLVQGKNVAEVLLEDHDENLFAQVFISGNLKNLYFILPL